MKQVAQNYRSGELAVLDVPPPACKPGGVLVRSLYSLISTGTELMKVSEARLSLLGKARARPDQVRKVLDSVAQQGPVATYKKAMNKLDSYTPLGLLAVRRRGRGRCRAPRSSRSATWSPRPATSSRCTPRSTGCRPTCACRCPTGVAPEHAAFATVGAIAMQGVRRAEVQLGETACVIGLGLVGQLVVRLLVAAGVRVVGIDTVEERCRMAEKAGAVACAGARRRGRRIPRAGAPHRDRWPRCRPRLPRRRRGQQRPGRARGPAGARPGPGRRHRQDPARPAVERLLREGARRPVLALLRPRPLRRPLRARRHRLPRRLRALDRATQPRVLPRPARRGGSIDVGSLVSGTHPDRRCRATSTRSCATEPCTAWDILFEYPRTEPREPHGPAGRRPSQRPRRPDAGTAPGRTSPSAPTVRLGFIGAGNYATSMLLPHLAADPMRHAGHGGDHAFPVRRQRTAQVRLRRGHDRRRRRPRRPGHRRRLRRHPPPLPRRLRVPCARGRQGGLRGEAPGAHSIGRRPQSSTVVERTGNDRLMVGFNRRFAPLFAMLPPAIRPGGRPHERALPGQRGAARPIELVPRPGARRISVPRRGRPLHRHR